jgi:uncharacterized protein involved in exopolysaccharide biosynthesis
MNSELQEIQMPGSASGSSPAVGLPLISEDVHRLTPARKAWVENLTIVIAHKWLIFIVTLLVTIATGIYAFLAMPDYYKAKAVILPARKAGGALDNITSGLASSLKDLGVSKLHGSGDESYSPLSLMRSREVMEKLVKQFHFQTIYNDPTMEATLEDFSGNLDGELGEEGNFIISFEDTSRQRAADVANAVVAEVNEVNSRLAKDEAEHNFGASKARFEQNLADLDSAERELGVFQRKYGVYALPEQARAELASLAAIEQQKYIAEIQLQTAEQMYGSNSSEVSVSKNTIEQLASKLAEMQTGLDVKAGSFVPSNVMPDVALQYLRLMREVEIQSKLKAFLLPAYEQAKLDEEKSLYGFVTLDHAVPPVKKSRPHRSTLLLGTLLGSIVISSIAVILLSNMKRLRVRFKRDQKLLAL